MSVRLCSQYVRSANSTAWVLGACLPSSSQASSSHRGQVKQPTLEATPCSLSKLACSPETVWLLSLSSLNPRRRPKSTKARREEPPHLSPGRWPASSLSPYPQVLPPSLIHPPTYSLNICIRSPENPPHSLSQTETPNRYQTCKQCDSKYVLTD